MKTIIGCLIIMTCSLQGYTQEKQIKCVEKNTTKNTAPKHKAAYVNPHHHITSKHAKPLFDKVDGTPAKQTTSKSTCIVKQQNKVVVTECNTYTRPLVPVFSELEPGWLYNSRNYYTGQYPKGRGIAPQSGNDAYRHR